jgi:hypothetical protein
MHRVQAHQLPVEEEQEEAQVAAGDEEALRVVQEAHAAQRNEVTREPPAGGFCALECAPAS